MPSKRRGSFNGWFQVVEHALIQEKAYEIEIVDKTEKAENETDPEKKSLWKKVVDILKLKRDCLRVRTH